MVTVGHRTSSKRDETGKYGQPRKTWYRSRGAGSPQGQKTSLSCWLARRDWPIGNELKMCFHISSLKLGGALRRQIWGMQAPKSTLVEKEYHIRTVHRSENSEIRWEVRGEGRCVTRAEVMKERDWWLSTGASSIQPGGILRRPILKESCECLPSTARAI